MSLNYNKRKAESSTYGKYTQTTMEQSPAFPSLYRNTTFMHSAASLVGCMVEVQLRDGTVYEGVFHTFSNKGDFVLEMAHKGDQKPQFNTSKDFHLDSFLQACPIQPGNVDKLIIELNNVVSLSVIKVDLDYVKKDMFSDAAVRKYYSQFTEKELEPWEGSCADLESNESLGVDDDDSNGWDANDMFRTNAEKYGVKSTYDMRMQEYTVPLTKQNTEEYRRQEAKALKIAQEIESNISYQSHIQLENGDEEDRFSAVARSENGNLNKYLPPQKRRNGSTTKPLLSSLPLSSANPYPIHSVPTSNATSNQVYVSSHIQCSAPSKQSQSPPLQTTLPSPSTLALSGPSLLKDMSMNGGREDEIEELKKFSLNFKLLEDSKEFKAEKDYFGLNLRMDEVENISEKICDFQLSQKEEGGEDKAVDILKNSTLNPNAKEFILNPNAKSFTPRSMTINSPQTPAPFHPQRMHSQSPVMAIPHPQMMSGMGQAVFAAVTPQYVVQATPVSMALTSPFTASFQQPPRLRKVPLMQPRHDLTPSMHVAAATGQPILAPNPIPVPSQLTMQYTPPPGMIHASGPPQQTMAYPQMSYVVGPRVMSPQPVGMVPTSHTVSYCDSAQLNAHMFMHAHPGAAALSAITAAHSMQQGVTAQHSNNHPPPSHTPVMHPSPSPVHQPPPTHVNPPQPPTPTTVMYPGQMSHQLQNSHQHSSHMNSANAHVAHHPAANFSTGPQPVVLMQGQTMSGSHGHHQHHPHYPGSVGTGPHPLQLHSVHQQNSATGSHIGNPSQVMSQMTVISTSAAMVSAPTIMTSSPFALHHQGESR